MRPQVDLTRGWEFLKGRAGRAWIGGGGAADEQAITLPHCWNRHDTFEPGAVYHQGHGAYRLAFTFSEADAGAFTWRLRSEGFYGVGDVWLNGRKLAKVDGQYLGFEIPLHAAPAAGRNLLVIRLDNRYRRNVLPGIRMPDFLLYGGMAGRVWIEGRRAEHFADAETWVYCATVSEAEADVRMPFAVEGATDGAGVRWRVLSPAGDEVAAQDVALTGMTGEARLVIQRPQRWSPEDPALYEAVGELRVGDCVRDTVRIRFGCRAAEFRPGAGFFLNGARCALHGCNRHESMPGFGNALPAALQRADARLLKQYGCNFVRLSHYPQSPAFLDACDELGLLVYAELASWKSVRGGGWLRAAERQFAAMIARDRHRPAVILWGMGNEARARAPYERLRALAGKLDPTRPVTYAENHLYRARRKGTLGIPDVWGCNYELDELEAGAAAARTGNVILSECSNYPPGVRGILAQESAQAELITGDLKKLSGRAAVAGFALWCWSDYATMRKQRFARHCGIVDAWRMPKLAALMMEAAYARGPVLHLRGDWGRAGGATREVHVIGNCGLVSLRVGDKELAQVMGPGWQRLTLAHANGTLVAYGEYRGREIRERLEPYGEAVALVLMEDGLVEGGDAGLVVLRARICDAAGACVTSWNGWLTVEACGGLLMAHTPDGRVPVAGGEGRIFVAVAGAGSVSVRAQADGLSEAVWPRTACVDPGESSRLGRR